MREIVNHTVNVMLLVFSQLVHGGLVAASNGELRTLLEFKKGIRGDQVGKLHGSWNPASVADPNTCPTSWLGISCNEAGNVISIALDHLGLEGDLKFVTLIGLTMLSNLSLSCNFFSGRLVPTMGSISSLQHLDLSDNQFYGPIPSRLNELWNLNYLNLSSNDFEGGFPSGLHNLQQLKLLDLHSNRLWGDIAAIMPELRNVETVDLSDNLFYGSLAISPENISSLANTVRHVNMSHNKLSGEFFSLDSILLLRNLEALDLGHNRILGALSSFRPLTNLRILRLQNNQLSGPIPRELLEGALPLAELDLSGNGFTGIIHNINCSILNAVNLSFNGLSGSLTPSLGDCTSVDFSNNLMSGDISIMQRWSSNLVVLDLSSNNLSGSFPRSTFSQFQNLSSFKIKNNSLTGTLPSAIGACPKLTTIDLSLNRLDGSIPRSYFSSLSLMTLNLSENTLTGEIPFDESSAKELLVESSYLPMNSLDLSGNYLAGALASGLGKLAVLTQLNLAKNNLSGQIPAEMSKLSGLKEVDLSCNNFSGTISDKLPSSLRTFNVSNNNLSGLVPKNLRHFPMSSFHPGNALLVFSDGFLSSNGHINYAKHHSFFTIIRVAIFLASFGAAVVIVIVLFAYRSHSQNFRGFCGQTTERDTKFRRFARSSVSRFLPVGGPCASSLSFSNDQLLTSRSLSGRPNLAIGMAEREQSVMLDNRPMTLGKPSSSSPSPASPRFLDAFEESVILDVRSPDHLAGQLFFLDGSVDFTVKQLSRAPAEVLGSSSHGTLYKATLDSGQMLSVKWLRVGLVKNRKEFGKEIKMIGSMKHSNIVPLRAYYWGPREQERLLLADYINGDSLALHLYETPPRRYSPLSFSHRLNVAVDVARGLLYLHDRGLPHGNLKPTNILLSSPNLDSFLTDHGLHRLMVTAGIAEQVLNLGALGYCSPELTALDKPVPTVQADVYAFGVIVLELLTGRSAGDIISGQSGAVDLPDWVRLCVQEGRGMDCIDREIVGEESVRTEMKELLALSLRCILAVNERPDMSRVFEDLCSLGGCR